MSEELNKMKQAFTNAFFRMHDKEEMLEKGRRFLMEYSRSFEGDEKNENYTQSFWYSMHLRKKRLKKKDITYRIRFEGQDKMQTNSDAVFWENDGKNTLTEVVISEIIHETYERNQKLLYRYHKNLESRIHYTESLKSEAYIICPNCAAQQTAADLLEGCRYCRSKFRLDDFKEKVIAYTYRRSVYRKTGDIILKMLAIGTGINIGLCLLMKIFLGASFFAGLFVLMLFLGVGILLIHPIVAIPVGFSDSYVEGQRKKAAEMVRKYDEQFSAFAFIGGLDYKLKSIHYADSMKDLQGFCQTDLSGILSQYRDVVDCSMQDYLIRDFRVDDRNQVAEIQVKLRLLIDKTDKLTEKEETIGLILIKDKNNKTQIVPDGTIFTCTECAGSISLLQGGICEYCGKKLELRKYDWVIADYKVY